MGKHLYKDLAVAILSISFLATTAFAGETWEVLAKASPDECFYGVGDDMNQYPLFGACEPPGQLKTNEAYVWGLTKFGDNIFFGTGQNIHCLVIQGYLGQDNPILTDDYVCEASANPPYGDLRPPSLYMYNETAGLQKLSLGVYEKLRQVTLGIRSAGTHPAGVVFMGGPGSSGINLFAFSGNTGQFLGATTIKEFSNVRKWLTGSDGNLYVGFGGGEIGVGGGAVMRWNGNPVDILDETSPNLSTLFNFEEVGIGLDGDAAELTEHEGRIFVTTWPGSGGMAGLWMSPTMPLTEADKENWIKKWSSTDFDPDPVTAYTYGGGALASFGGWVYWGTMHVPGVALVAHSSVYGESSDEIEFFERLFGTWRAISIFRGRSFDSPYGPEIELLYGNPTLSAYLVEPGENPLDPNAPRSWQTVQNKMSLFPIYGFMGFNNYFNNYCWTMRVYNNDLYVGTMDHSYLIAGSDSSLDLIFDTPEYGADLYRFNNNNSEAVAVSLDGMDNPMNYGIRTMITDDTALYLGTANPMNLNPDGGWELIKLLAPPPATVPNCAGMTLAEAEAAILDANLSVGNIGFACSHTEGAGIITSQNLAAGTQVSPGTEVDLVVSNGPCLAPDCVGLTEAEARTAITDAGFDVGTIESQCHRTAPAGTVIGQNPDAGTAGSPGSSVNLTVSTGPCPLNGRSTVDRRNSSR